VITLLCIASTIIGYRLAETMGALVGLVAGMIPVGLISLRLFGRFVRARTHPPSAVRPLGKRTQVDAIEINE
jgi:hypothetical protein